ncbi:unnamed protein product, partial [Gongylonema pulchrum]|uniref:MIF4G domain-containing protein n=1 Tax=Gongylonema pulchrum TaxID=637853 RepID=A0A183F0S2_9BILA
MIETMFSMQPNQLFEATCGSLAELLRKPDSIKAELSAEEFRSLCDLLGKIASSRKDTLTLKMKESIIHCLGFLSSHALQTNLYGQILTQLYATGEIASEPEMHFTIGESIADVAFSESSPMRRNIFTESEETFL